MPRTPPKPGSGTLNHSKSQGSLFDDIAPNDHLQPSVRESGANALHKQTGMLKASEEDALAFSDVLDSQYKRDAVLSPFVGDTCREAIVGLREDLRALSELIIDTNRDIARIAFKPEGLESPEARELLTQLSNLEERRAIIETKMRDELKTPKSMSRGIPNKLHDEKGGGLLKVRHPNRDFFLADLFDYAMKDDGVSMEAPIFTLSTKPDLSIWEWHSKDGAKHIKVAPSVLGRASQHDKDILIYIVSQLIEGINIGRDDARNRTVRFTVYDFLVTTNRDTSGAGYQRLHEAFERLRGTTITTDIRTGGTRVREGFGIIDRWKIIEKSPTDERMIAVEVTLSEWLYNAVQAFEVLTIHPDYFRLRKPLARRLYEIARKHCGHQAQWTIGLHLLQEKSGSKSSIREFRRALRLIEDDNSLPEYRFTLGYDDRVTFTFAIQSD